MANEPKRVQDLTPAIDLSPQDVLPLGQGLGGLTRVELGRLCDFIKSLLPEVRDGVDGATIRSGAVVPAPELGNVGDFYIQNRQIVYGPKAAEGWGAGVSILGTGDATGLATLANPAFTGTPTAPTPAPGSNSHQIATAAFVRAEIAALVGAAPGQLDTLAEIAARFADNEDAAAAVIDAVDMRLEKSANLSDIADPAAARENLGIPRTLSSSYSTFAEASASVIPLAISSIRTLGRLAKGDGGGAVYDRWAAGMVALPAGAQGVWWFTDAGGARWKLADGQEYTPPMFGAMGDPLLTLTTIAQNYAGAKVDDQPRIQAALDAPMVQTLKVTRQHWFGSDIRVPSYKAVLGLDRSTTGFHRIPLVGNQAAPTMGVYCEDAVTALFANFFVNCQRSGWAGLPADNIQQLLNRCSGVVVRGASRGARVVKVDVYNSWGYSHYTTLSPAGGVPLDTMRIDCKAYNGDTGFETTAPGATETVTDCWVYREPIDGGVEVSMECGFHTYAGVARVTRIRCGFRGAAAAVLDVISDGLNSGTIENIDCDYAPSRGYTAIDVRNPDTEGVGNPGNVGKKVLNYVIRNCRVMPSLVDSEDRLPFALQANFTNVTIEGGEFGGLGIIASEEGRVDLRGGPKLRIGGPYPAFITALDAQGGGTINWFGKAGAISVVNTTTPAFARVSDGAVTFHDKPIEISPALPGEASGVALRYIQKIGSIASLGGDGALDLIDAGDVGGKRRYWKQVLFPAVPASHSAVQIQALLLTDKTVGDVIPLHSIQMQWRAPNEGLLLVTAEAALSAGTKLQWSATELAP